jgi:hypothetical protein
MQPHETKTNMIPTSHRSHKARIFMASLITITGKRRGYADHYNSSLNMLINYYNPASYEPSELLPTALPQRLSDEEYKTVQFFQKIASLTIGDDLRTKNLVCLIGNLLPTYDHKILPGKPTKEPTINRYSQTPNVADKTKNNGAHLQLSHVAGSSIEYLCVCVLLAETEKKKISILSEKQKLTLLDELIECSKGPLSPPNDKIALILAAQWLCTLMTPSVDCFDRLLRLFIARQKIEEKKLPESNLPLCHVQALDIVANLEPEMQEAVKELLLYKVIERSVDNTRKANAEISYPNSAAFYSKNNSSNQTATNPNLAG